MSRSVFFCRHGKVGDDTFLSEQGKTDIESVKVQLHQLGWEASQALSSTAKRCIQTSRILVPEPLLVNANEALHAYVDWQAFINQRGWSNLSAKSEKINLCHFEQVVSMIGQKTTLVVGHDCAPSILAFKLLEKRDAAPNWYDQPRNITHLEKGCGILVDGNSYHYIAPK